MAAPSGPDFFSFIGLSRKLNLDMADLEQRYRTLSRQFHPDFFYNATPAERRASLERSSYLNDAYRTLKNPIARVEYLLKLEGMATPSGHEAGNEARSNNIPAGLLEEVFALNEELDEVREMRAGGAPAGELKARLERARRPIDAKRDEHEAQLAALSKQWDALVDGKSDAADVNADVNNVAKTVLAALRDRVLERNYINNLLAGIERELNS